MKKRRWRFIYLNGEKTKYKVSDDGKVKNTERNGALLSLNTIDRYGYVQVSLSHKNKQHTKTLHTLVANAFLVKPDWANQVNHKNGNKKDNNYINLEWTDGKGNIQHAYRTGLHDNVAIGGRHGLNVYSEKDIRKVCELLEKGKATVKSISEKTSVPKSTICDIIAKKYWTHISKDYEIDNYKKSKHDLKYGILNKEYRDKIEKLAKAGFSSKEIRKKLNLKYTDQVYSIISYNVNKYQKK